VPQKTIQDIKLPQLLSHPATLELMKDVLAKNLSPENIALWIDIQRYRSLENTQVRKAVADEIFQTFIVTGAKYEVNLSSFMKDYVQTHIYKNKITVDLFDEVEREIYRLMVTNNVEALVTGPMFKLAAIVLQHPSYKLKSMTFVNNVRGEIGGNQPSTIGQNASSSAAATGGFGSAPSQNLSGSGRNSPVVGANRGTPRGSGAVTPNPVANPSPRPSVLVPPSATGTPRSLNNNFTNPTAASGTPRDNPGTAIGMMKTK